MFSTLITILPIFAIIVFGKILKEKYFKAEEFWRTSEKITYYVLFPALLINALIHANFHAAIGHTIIALMLSTLLVATIILVFQYFMKTDVRTFTSFFQGSVRYNSYIFIGVSAALFGTKGIAIVAIIISYMIVLTNVISVMVLDAYLNGNVSNLIKLTKNIAKNPLILASITGVLLNQVAHFVPVTLTAFLDYIGNAALPLSLLCVGAGLNLKHLYHKRTAILSATFAKLIILPVVSILFLSFFHVSGLPKLIAILYSAVPCAGNAYILAQQMGGDSETMASIISVTTLLSILTIPLILALAH